MAVTHVLARRSLTFFLTAMLSMRLAIAQEADTYYQEQHKLIKAPNAVMALGDSPFGESINLYNGRLEFVQNDLSLAGNNALPVAVGRRIVAGEMALDGRQFGEWEMDIPHIHGTFASVTGWRAGDNTEARCTKFGRPPLVAVGGSNNRSYWDPTEYWQGTFVYVPGQGDQQMLQRSSNNHAAPGPAQDYPVVTARFWSIACLPQLKNGIGEGFLAISPDGTKYYFDWMAKFDARRMTKSDPSERPGLGAGRAIDSQVVTRPPSGSPAPHMGVYVLTRDDVWLLPSRVVDRFGNVVTYTYDPSKPRNLQRIDSSDGRSITISYAPTEDGRFEVVDTLTDNVRAWHYKYRRNSASGKTELERVVLPDATAWDFSNFYPLIDHIRIRNLGWCGSQPSILSLPATGSLVHPSGAVGNFTLSPIVHGRSRIPNDCDVASNTSVFPLFFATLSLTSRSITGPGLAPLTWTYDYGPPNASWSTCTSCVSTKTVTVTDPSNHVTRYAFGNAYNVNEGRLEATEIGWDGVNAAKTIQQRYRAVGAGPYPEFVGFADDGNIGDSDLTARLAPVDQRITSEQGVNFTWEAQLFDSFARPLTVRRSSSLGMARTEKTAYFDHISKWILGQVESVTEVTTGKVITKNGYDPATANLTSVSRFGHLEQAMTYYADGSLFTRKDARNPATVFSNYKFGIPQSVRYPDGSSESAVVNGIGKIKSITDAVGATTTFEYDAIGRLAKIGYPTNDSVPWVPTFVTFAPSPEPAFSLPAGHWRQTVQTGNAYTVNYYDALWRPVYTASWDQTDRDNTMRITWRWYDHAGRVTYESYPKRNYAEISAGTHQEYDATGRRTITARISELGTLFSGNNYGSAGFRKIYTDAKQHDTVFGYQVFDEPSEDAITSISMPEGVTVAIERDLFGKPISITRSGSGKSVTRSYVYDSNERLCKIIEPEVGATVIEYDAANNVLWRAPGLNLPSRTGCDRSSVPFARQIYFEYDARNRLKRTIFRDGGPQITRDYWPDGILRSTSSAGATWNYVYNKRRLIETEQLSYGGATYTLGRKYNEDATVRQLTYPGNLTIDYEPNALGEPRRVGNYATAIKYHPNGAIASFTYGNGITHTMVPNTRGLPLQVIDNGVLNDVYTYDRNGNPETITDVQEGIATRGMTYDGLDRLKTVSASRMWGNAAYEYDALDNLTATNISGGATARNTTHIYNPTTNRLDKIIGPAEYNLSYLYDDYGNVKQRGSQQFVFDLGNRMRSARGKGTYLYDGLGHRVSVVGTDGVNRIQLYSQDGRLMYSGSTSGPQTAGTKYIYLDRHVLAEVGAGGSTQYDHTDGLGSPVARSDSSRAILNRSRFEPFGATAAGATGAIGFTGHSNAADLGLVYMVARYYDPAAGRFLSTDPALTDAKNGTNFSRYAYANNNPYKYIDPDGREARDIEIDCMPGNCTTYGGPSRSGPGEWTAPTKLGAVLGGVAGGALAAGCDIYTFGACVPSNPGLVGAGVAGGALIGASAGAMLSSGSAVLAKNIAAATGTVKRQFEASHHIVAENDPRAAGARAILAMVNMDINSAFNGMTMSSRYHSRLHTNVYHASVEAALSGASSYAEVAATLTGIRFQINAGIFPF